MARQYPRKTYLDSLFNGQSSERSKKMPIYEYECLKCQKVTEAIQKFSDAPLSVCPRCSGEMKKLVSSSSFHLKGGGWYADGYSNSGNCPKAAGCAKAESTGGAVKESSGTPSTPPCGGCA
jgi:putative FmdB family regulatory protein